MTYLISELVPLLFPLQAISVVEIFNLKKKSRTAVNIYLQTQRSGKNRIWNPSVFSLFYRKAKT